MSDYDFISRLNELKEEYASQKGWNEEDNYWYENDEHLYEAECYAYGILEKEERLNNYDFVMSNYLDDCFAGAKLVEKNGASYIVEYEGKRLNIEFDPDWEEYVYSVNGKGPFSHSSYEYIGQDCRQVLAIEEQEREKLAVKLNAFYKNFDHYGYMDCLDSTNTEEVLDSELAAQLSDGEAVVVILETLYDIKENGELDEEQLKVLNGLIKEVESIQASFATSLDDKLASAKEKSSLTETTNNKDVSIERDALGE